MEIKVHTGRPLPKKRTGNQYRGGLTPTKRDYVLKLMELRVGDSIDVPFDAGCLRQHLYDLPQKFTIRKLAHKTRQHLWGVWRIK